MPSARWRRPPSAGERLRHPVTVIWWQLVIWPALSICGICRLVRYGVIGILATLPSTHTNWCSRLMGAYWPLQIKRTSMQSRFTTQTLANWSTHTRPMPCSAVTFSADGKRLAAESQNEIFVWDLATGEKLHTLRGHRSTITAIAFDSDDRLLASASQDRQIKLWDTRTGRLQRTLRGHRAAVRALAFAPDDRSLVTGANDGSVKVWHVATGRELLELKSHAAPITRIVFSPDGRSLAYLSALHALQLIHIPKHSQARVALAE